MKMNVQIFSHPLFGDIRVAGTFMEPLFCLVDVCNALDIKNPSRAKTALKPGGVHQMKVTNFLLFHLFYHPILYTSLVFREVNTHFHNLSAIIGKSLGIVLITDLRHGDVGRLLIF